MDIDLKDLDAKELAKRYNRRFVYNSDVPLIEYAAREPIENGIFASDKYVPERFGSTPSLAV